MTIKKILVTGSSGTIGTRLCEKLLEENYEIVGVDLKPNKCNDRINRLTIIGDLRNKQVLENLPNDIDLVIHLAANARVYNLVVDPNLARDNFEILFNTLEFCRKNDIKRFVFASSREVYGNSKQIVHTENEAYVRNCESPYTASKIGGEALVHAYHQCYGINFIIIRFSNVYGMYDDSDRVIPLFIRLTKGNKDLVVYGKEKLLDFTYIDDAISGVLKCIKNFDHVKNDVFNIASGKGVSIIELAQLIQKYTNSKNKIVIKENRTGEVVKFIADISKAKETFMTQGDTHGHENNKVFSYQKLSYEPKTTIDDGIRKSIKWYIYGGGTMDKEGEGVLILGAGPAGMAAAFELNKAGKSFTVIEKNEQVGGLARTFQYGEFRTDTGPHRFFSQNQYLYDFIEDLLGKHWIKVDRLTRFYINGKFFLYPVELKNALFNVGPYKAFKILFDYLSQRIKKIFVNRNPVSFEEQVVSDFGRALAELNMLNYTEKIWGLLCSKISPDWSKQRIKGLSLMAVIKNALTKSKEGPKTLVDQFYYPDTGTGLIYEKIEERILAYAGGLRLNSYPIEVIHDGNEIRGVMIADDNQIIKPEFVISSIPITEFVNLLKPEAPDEVLQATKNLKFRSHVSLFLTLNKSSVFSDQWIYFPDKEIPFGRIMEPKNFSKKMSPPDKTSLLVEFFCWENDKIWNASKKELFELSIEWLERLGFIKREEVIDSFIHREKYAYPVYDLEYKDNLGKIKDYLKQFKNLQLIGRAGSFRYNNQDHALEMGILAARSIIEKKQYNLEEVGAEQEYFERGYVR